jgi:ribosome biogenesis GTPase
VFADVEAAAAGCRFRDCAHDGEPGCAVAAAVEAGTMPAERLGSYHKLVREARVAAMKTDARLRSEDQRRWKSISKDIRRYYRETGRG